MPEAPRLTHRLAAALAAAVCTAAAAQADSVLSVQADEPRAFGWRVGDLVTRQFAVHVPDGLTLDRASLPAVGRVGASFELRRSQWSNGSSSSAGTHTLVLQYQIFRAPGAVRTLELPPVTLRFAGVPRAKELRIDAWPVTVAPLVPLQVSPRRGLGELQPDAAPPLVDTRPSRLRLAAYSLLSLPLVAYLAHVYLGAPWWRRRQRPFARAWRALRNAGSPRAALQCFHEALNQSAGAVLFEPALDGFLREQPRYAALRDDLRSFFAASRAAFFGPAQDDAALQARMQTLMPWLRELCRRCRDAESGAA